MSSLYVNEAIKKRLFWILIEIFYYYNYILLIGEIDIYDTVCDLSEEVTFSAFVKRVLWKENSYMKDAAKLTIKQLRWSSFTVNLLWT